MAEYLQREHELPVIKVRLDEEGRVPVVRLELVATVDGKRSVGHERSCRLEELGFADLTDRKARELQLEVPEGVGSWLAEWVNEELDPGTPALWLHLVKPYGLLGGVPWERRLQPACDRPLLRLPDVLPSMDRVRSEFEIALCATAPADEGPSTAAGMAPWVADAIAKGVGEHLRLHVFADRVAHDQLEHELAGLPIRGVVVHRDPDSPTGAGRGAQNGWLRWISQAMNGRTLDAVHFITHGYTLGMQGAMLTTREPTSESRRYPEPVQARELRTFLTQVGAPIAGFTTPVDNYSDFGLLRLVDDLGAMRAGPVLLHDGRSPEASKVLRDAYELLADPAPGWPPAHPSLVLFAQPRQLRGIEAEKAPVELRSEHLRSSEAVEAHFRQPDTPQWLSAAERFISDNEAELLRFWRSIQEESPTRAQTAHYQGVEEALGKIRAIVDRHARARL